MGSTSIEYTMDDSPRHAGMNEAVYVKSDNQSLYFEALEMQSSREKLTMQGAAELFWRLHPAAAIKGGRSPVTDDWTAGGKVVERNATSTEPRSKWPQKVCEPHQRNAATCSGEDEPYEEGMSRAVGSAPRTGRSNMRRPTRVR